MANRLGGIIAATLIKAAVFIAAPILLFLGDWRDRRAASSKAEVAETG